MCGLHIENGDVDAVVNVKRDTRVQFETSELTPEKFVHSVSAKEPIGKRFSNCFTLTPPWETSKIPQKAPSLVSQVIHKNSDKK